MGRTKVLVSLACLSAVAAAILGHLGLASEWLAAGAAGAVAILALLTSLLVGRIAGAWQGRDTLAGQVEKSVFQPQGRLPRVREISNPIAIGVHPAPISAANIRGSDRVPAYVVRDIDHELHNALLTGGFTLLVGEASAGKTRTAFEAMRMVLPDHRLVAPSSTGDLSAAISRARDERKCILWLDNLQAFLRNGAISRKEIAELLSGSEHHRVVLSTIRVIDESRLTGRLSKQRRSSPLFDIGQGVLDQVQNRIFIERLFTIPEQARARELAKADDRLADALNHADHVGLAEYMAWGPQLFYQWQDAWARGNKPRAAALITAAVDCRRAGFTGPLPQELLTTMHESYLFDKGGAALIPEDIDAAWDWVFSLRESGSAPLQRIDADDCDVFDYLVDEYRRRNGEVAPEQAVRAALDHAGPVDASGIAMTAWQQDRHELARSALQRQYAIISQERNPDDPILLALRANLAVTELYLDGYRNGLPAAEGMFRDILAALATLPHADPDYLNTVRGKLANVLFAQHKMTEAEMEYRTVIAARTAMFGDEHPSTLICRNNLALALTAMNRLDEAEVEHRAVLQIRHRTMGPDHPHTRVSADNLEAVLKRREHDEPSP